MCMSGGCGGGGGRRSHSSNSYTPKKMKNASRTPSNSTWQAGKPRGAYKSAATFGSAHVNMSNFGRKRY